MAKFTFFFLCLTAFNSIAQTPSLTPDALQISGGISTHGTGDLRGFMVEAAHEHSLSRRFDLNTGLATSLHFNGVDEFGSTTGVQLGTMLNFNFLHPASIAPQKIRIGAGPLVRFEHSTTASNFSRVVVPGFSSSTVFVFNKATDTQVFTVGYQVAIGYLAQVGKKFQLGIKAGFQNDTDGAVITRVGLVFGRYVRMAEFGK
ncbi:MAG: hypothetical protein IT258_22675 [Saprospiraceae bacterium]|nr:hypothetical protein [Saprospiraceae bacterium]